MSRLRSSGVSSRPAGRPSTTHVKPGPCDSPAVIRWSATPPSLFAGDSVAVAVAPGGVSVSAKRGAAGEHQYAELRGGVQVGNRLEPIVAQQRAPGLGLAAQDI